MDEKKTMEFIERKQKLKKINIEMFEKAQKYLNWKPKIGDRVWDRRIGVITEIKKLKGGERLNVFFESMGGYIFYGKEDLIWLPSQEHMRRMSCMTWMQFDMNCLNLWLDLATYSETKQDLTKETIGLRVVMEERFNKIWNGEDWKEVV